ncbi:PD-(D/E)XK nuclease-like domain-containing protein [Pantoea dispersa]|uniref:PD-(D/E)XK nuclease-like domain-containing protein n=1 Tax=Pantoea dispersa TaxID=59814 RepID=UPI0021C9F3E0|nr:PD-(D/E)XK nuclease-like domain-containing protein [Pantoea dispersa]UXO70793.1 PD-(D/E)XK nuclease-like domain-containing protein [Pantoea dispersa]
MKPDIYYDLSHEAYHTGPGVCKSQLDDIALNPAVYLWRKYAPVDEAKTAALEMGSALHCLLLEPDRFDIRYVVAPNFNRRTTEGKISEQAYLRDCAGLGLIVLDAEQSRKLQLMRESVFAHPAARWLLEADGHCEASIYWNDDETGELCRIRPDKFLTGQPVIADVKKVADMARFARHVEEFRYHVQDAYYRKGFSAHFGEYPQFVFIAVSENIDCGRYPVRAFQLHAGDVETGHQLFRRDLNTYHQCRISNSWGGVEELRRPAWARKQDNLL